MRIGRIIAKPRPIAHSWLAILTSPTGALTEISISFSKAILEGSLHHTETLILFTFPNSSFA